MDAAGTAGAPNLTVTFWGVQGSCPSFPSRSDIEDFAIESTDRAQRGAGSAFFSESPRLPRPEFPFYGGETTCVEVVTAEKNTLLFDLGSGLRDFSRHAADHWGDRPRQLNIFLSHEHLDHRNGFAFAGIFHDPQRPFDVVIHGTRQALAALDSRYGIFSRSITSTMHVDDPVDYRMLSASFRAVEAGTAPIAVGRTIVTPFEVYHGNTACLGYRVEHAGSSFVFCTDHELRRGPDANDPRQLRSLAAERRLREFCQNIDLAYFDGQYQLAEYRGEIGIGARPAASRLDWGHSCMEDVIERAEGCRVRRALIGHHDPDRPWRQRRAFNCLLHEQTAAGACRIEMAKAGETIEI